MSTLTYTVPVVGNPNSTEDPKVATALTNILSFANGGIDSTNVAANAGLLKLIALANRKINFGTISLTWSGGLYSNTATVPHGLGVTPQINAAFVNFADAVATVIGVPDATNIQVLGRAFSGTLSGTVNCWWLAIG